MKVKSFSPVGLFETRWTVAYQAPPSMGFSRHGYWSGLPFPSPIGPPRTKQKKDVLFIIGDWSAKVGSQEIPGIMESLALKYKMKQAKAIRVLSRECTHNSKQPFQQPQRQLYTWTVPVGEY